MATATDLTIEGRPSNFSECSSLSSVLDDGEFTQTNCSKGSINRTRSCKWKKLMKKLVEESKKSFYRSSKPLVFSYDAVITPLILMTGIVTMNVICINLDTRLKF
uniref:Uncharacterized protein n=1 Tax=Helianthus annuus TaxID=4232 RepID=A0A251TXZ9_HELAN